VKLFSLIQNNLPREIPEDSRVFNLKGSSSALLLALVTEPYVAVEKNEEGASALRKDIGFYRRLLDGAGEVQLLPDPNGPASAGSRARVIYDLKASDSMVTSARSLSSGIVDGQALLEGLITLKAGEILTRQDFEDMLVRLGYRGAPMVAGVGEYSRRGWIFDVFPSTSEYPIRVEFFGDEIEQVKTFDIESQRSKEDLDEFLLFPAVESEDVRDLPSLVGGKRFFRLYPDEEGEIFPAGTVFLSRYAFQEGASDEDGEEAILPVQIDAGVLSLRGRGVLPDERKGVEELPESVRMLSEGNRVILVASSQAQAERLRDVFREKDLIVPVVEISDLAAGEEKISITVGELSSGVLLRGLALLTEKEVFGERPSFRSIKRSKVANLLLSVDDITPGDYVVHRDHGIGRFSGAVRQKMDESELELMVIEYEGGRVYLPVQNIEKLSKYRSEEGVTPKVDKLGGKSWQKKKERVRKKVRDMAAQLLALYAGRKVARGFSFSPDTELHREFDSFFAYEETPDQLKAIEDIKKDMESDLPMDRLVCGDVGYGKTEVAMRAAFKAIYDGRQVAVLVPTTILAEQHYRTFEERFSGFPVKADFISRFKSRKEIGDTLAGLARGDIDIIIGTHGLLSKKVTFNRLGLLIVDEEHRFGVGQKEKIKELSKNVDVLNLSATPIPRTLHMALSGIRNISVIETPPEERLAVKSIVTVFNDQLVREAIRAELDRQGQVFFVHNRIHDIYRVADHIQQLVPGARVGVAHGQMPEKELETVMHLFFGGEVSVLISTAIIGSGLDVSRANTIIIDRADKMGLADLYQIRGRVGRSNRKGYAFFLAPPESQLTEDARRRLDAVQEMSYLGAGFRLALKDLEIRGAGDIFGAEQSGHIQDIGFDLYIEMLEKAVAELKGEEISEEPEPAIDLQTSAYIPDEYIEDVTLRLSFYRRIASLKTDDEVGDFESELKDRFGTPPEQTRNLLKVMRLKILARHLRIMKVQEAAGKVQILFSPDTVVEPSQIFALHEGRKKTIRFLPEGFELDMRKAGREKFFEEVSGVLKELRDHVDRVPV